MSYAVPDYAQLFDVFLEFGNWHKTSHIPGTEVDYSFSPSLFQHWLSHTSQHESNYRMLINRDQSLVAVVVNLYTILMEKLRYENTELIITIQIKISHRVSKVLKWCLC